ncbi:EAL domain-containing protein [Halorhodospira abdelmalekii]|uniref:EAL domain-containing protein n=1 Tax=Halorhodospira abdelmalekii TaxID=421629 RepID=UPI0019035E3F|nr:EAL domain-containing protein [Halorhodospira abdelmalekii]
MTSELEIFIRRKTQEHGLTLTEVARRAGMSRQSLYEFWRRQSLPNLSTVVELATVFELHPLRLLELYFAEAPSDDPPANAVLDVRYMRDRAHLTRVLFEQSGEALIGLDGQHRITLYNAAAETLFQRPAEEVRGQPAETLLPQHAIARIADHSSLMSEQIAPPAERARGQLRIISHRGDGEPLTFSARVLEVPLADQSLVVLLLQPAPEAQAQQALPAPIGTGALQHTSATGITHPDSLPDLLEQMMRFSAWLNARMGLIVFELEGIDAAHERLGGEVIEQVQSALMRRLSTHLRRTDRLAQLSTTTFALLLPGIDAAERGQQLAQRAQQLIREPVSAGALTLNLAAPMGVAIYPDHSEDAETLLRLARSALTDAQRHGAEAVRLVDTALTRGHSERVTLLQELRTALAAETVELRYEPIYQLGSGELTGLEARLRWHSTTLGCIEHDALRTAAAEGGVQTALEEWLIDRALSDAGTWRQQGLPVPRLTIDVSAASLREETFAPELLSNQAVAHKLAAGKLELELSERELGDPESPVMQRMSQLRARGLSISIDHFGAGFASLLTLPRIPADAIKLTSTLARDAGSESDYQALTGTVADLASRFRLRLNAEGVEDRETAERLHKLGFQEAQGPHFRAMLSAEETGALLAEAMNPVS